MGEREEVRCFREAVRARIENAARDAGRDVGEIPPPALVALLCAAALSAVARAGADLARLGAGPAAGSEPAPLTPAGGALAALVASAIDTARGRAHGQFPPPEDLEREIFWRIQQILVTQNGDASALRAEIAAVLAETDAMRSALLAAIETGNDRLRQDVIAAIDTLSSGFPEMTFLLRAGDQGAAEWQHHLDGRGAEVRALGDVVRRQAADVRIAREDLAAIRQRQARAGSGEPGDAQGPRWTAGCPYLGLLPFDQAHAEVFYGRQRMTAELIVKLAGRLAGPSMVVVSGASGAGKSSLLHAGLLPALAAGRQLEGSQHWPRVVMTPTGDPLTELATRLAALGGGDAQAIRHALAAAPERAGLTIGQAAAAGHPGRLILVVDQFEEVFTLAPGGADAGQQAFIAALCAAATRPAGPRGEPSVVVVVAVRGDYWVRCAAHAGLARLMQDGLFVVGPMTGPELREAITGPATAAGLTIDANLADVILADLHAAGQEETEGVLPLLSQAMMLTWSKREGSRLTVRGYNETGGVTRSVEYGAEAVYTALPDAGQHVAKEIFQALVLVSPDGQLARRAVTRGALVPARRDGDRRAVDTVLEAFAASRLLVLDRDTAQIAHDVLPRAWPRLRGWLESDQASWLLYAQLQEDAGKWAGHGRDLSFLYRGSELAAVQQAAARWAADPVRHPALTDDESAFLAASRQNAARGARMRRVAMMALAVLLVMAAGGVAVATQADRSANQQRIAALSNQLAAQSEALDATDPVQAAALATAAWKIDPTAEARTSLLDILAQPERATLKVAGNVTTVVFSPDGKRLVTETETGVVQTWDPVTRREIGRPLKMPGSRTMLFSSNPIWFRGDGTLMTFRGGSGNPSRFWDITTGRALGSPIQIPRNSISRGIFSPDGRVVATSAANGRFGLLDVATHQEIGTPIRAADPLAFSPDSKLVALGYAGGSHGVQLVDAATGQRTGSVMPGGSGAQGPVAGFSPDGQEPIAGFSPDGQVLAVGGGTSVSFWSVAGQHAIGAPIAAAANQFAFSPDGKTLATVSGNGTRSSAETVNLWDAASHQELGGALTVNATAPVLTFSPDSTTLITGSGSTLTFWDIAVSRQLGSVISGTQALSTFSPDGRIVAALTAHGAGLWDVATHRQLGKFLPITQHSWATTLAFSPDGKQLATSGPIGAGLEFWDVATHRRIGSTVRSQVAAQVQSLAFSPDGKYIAVGGVDGGLSLWDRRAGRMAGPRTKLGGEVSVVVFSPDSRVIFTATEAVRRFDVATRRPIGRPFATGIGAINDMALSPDGGTVAVATDTGATLWDVASERQIGTQIDTGVGSLNSVAFSPDGRILAVAAQDGAIRLWDVASHEQVGSSLVVNQNGSGGLTFSPDGSMLAADNGNAIRLWGVVTTRDILQRVCILAGGSMNRQRWDAAIKSVPYQRTCP
jgi:WD40 repeat protein